MNNAVIQQKVRMGLSGVGLDTYWRQFEGLLPRLSTYQDEIAVKIEAMDIQVINTRMVGSLLKANECALQLERADVELVLLFISTYTLSSTILSVTQRVGKPTIILNIQPASAIDYQKLNSMGDRGRMTGKWLVHYRACSVPESMSVLNRAGVRYDITTGYSSEDYAWEEIASRVGAVRVICGIRTSHLGILEHYYRGMPDVHIDPMKQSAVSGIHIELLETYELKVYRGEVSDGELKRRLGEFYDKFSVEASCSPEELIGAVRTSMALGKLVNAHQPRAMAYYYEGFCGDDHGNIVTSVIAGNTLLTGYGVPVAGECKVRNTQTMRIMSLLKAGSSFSEFYAMDLKDDIALLGHDGLAHFVIAEEKVKLMPPPLYHDKLGKGLSIQVSVRPGDVTLLSICEGRDGVSLLITEGEAVQGETLHTGNTNSRYHFPCGARRFMDQWGKAESSHYYAINIGHKASELRRLAFLLSILVVAVE